MIQALASAAQPAGDLTVYGPLGILAAASLAAAVIVYRDQRKQIAESNARADRIAAEKDALTKDLMEKVVPVLTQAVTAFAELQRRGPTNGG